MEHAYIRVHTSEFEGSPLLEVSGDIDLSTLSHLQRALDNALQKDTPHLIIDLRNVLFIDSSGVGALISTKKKLLQRRGELHLICGDDHIRRKLGIMKLGHIMRLHTSLEDCGEEIRRNGHRSP